jgi:hypothetical protein
MGVPMSEALNPYQSPRTNGQPDGRSTRRLTWKVYAVAVSAVQVTGFVLELPRMNLTEALDYVVTLVGTIGLFGFAFRRRLLRRPVWKLWAVLLPLWDTVMGIWVYPAQGSGRVQEGYFIAMLLFVPQYLALLRYGYSSYEIWESSSDR